MSGRRSTSRRALCFPFWFASSVILIVSALTFSGCGGGRKKLAPGGGPTGQISVALTDSQGQSLSDGSVQAGRSVVTALSSLRAITQYHLFLFGPPDTRTSTAPDGRAVTAFLRLTANALGQIPATILDYDLKEGDYTLEVQEVSGRGGFGRQVLRASFRAVGLRPTDPFIFIENDQGNAVRSFEPGQNIRLRGQGLPLNSEVDLYIVQDKASWQTGDPLVDLSGTSANAPPPDLPRGRTRQLSLSGTAERVTTDANGAFPATVVWTSIPADAVGVSLDAIADVNKNGVFDRGVDVVNDEMTTGIVIQSPTVRRQQGHFIANISVAEGTCARKDTYYTTDNVFGLINPSTRMQLGRDRWVKKYVVAHRELSQWTAGTPLVDVSGPAGANFWEADTVESGCTNEGCVLLWPAQTRPGEYDIVIDVNRNDVYDPGVDILDGTDDCGGTVGFRVIGQQTRKKWTILVYIGGDTDLEGAAIEDINEMEQIGSTNDVNIVVQIDRHSGHDTSNGNWTTARRYYITRDTDTNTINSTMICDLGEVNMGDPATLQDFIVWTKTQYPADRYFLILWDHGLGFRDRSALKAVSRNVVWDEANGNDSLSLPEIATAVRNARGVDIIGFDACLMAEVETAVQMQGAASFLVASEDLEPGDGWEYHRFLDDVASNPNITPRALAVAVVAAYREAYSSQAGSTLSATDLSRVDAVQSGLDSLARAIMEDPDGSGPQQSVLNSARADIISARNASQRFAGTRANLDDYRDAFHFAQLLKDAINDPEVDSACDSVMAAISNAVVQEFHSSDLPNAHGLTIWLPDRSRFNNSIRHYADHSFPRQTQWDEFLGALWGLSLRIELTWGAEPRDLDSHLWDAAGNHLYFLYAGPENSPIPGAWLDLDDTTGFGPENISIEYLVPQGSARYTYAVHLYAGSASTETSTVRVFRGGSTVPERTFTFSGWDPNRVRWWHVFDINPENGQIIPVNSTTLTPPRGITRALPPKTGLAARVRKGKRTTTEHQDGLAVPPFLPNYLIPRPIWFTSRT